MAQKARGRPRGKAAYPDDEELPEDEAFAPGEEKRYEGWFPEENNEEEEGEDQSADESNELGEEEEEEHAEGFNLEELEEEESSEQAGGPEESNDNDIPEDSRRRIAQALSSRPEGAKRKRTVAGDEREGEFQAAVTQGAIAADDLFAPLAQDANFGALKNKLSTLKKVKPAPAALSQTVAEKESRAVAFERAAGAVSRWQPIVKANREATHMEFPLNVPSSIGTSTSELTAKFEPRSDMEKKLDEALEESGMSGKRSEEAYDELPDVSNLEQMQERHAQLAKMRNMLFYQELKWKRQKKIKSKSYHKVLKKEKMKRAALAEPTEENAQEQALAAERARIKERFELRHKNQSRWAKRLLTKGNMRNPANRRALEEAAKIGQQLRKKMVSTEEEGSENNPAEEEVEAEDGGEGGGGGAGAQPVPTKGLMGMKFMQRAMVHADGDEIVETALQEEEQEEGSGKRTARMVFAGSGSSLPADSSYTPTVDGEQEEGDGNAVREVTSRSSVKITAPVAIEAPILEGEEENPWLQAAGKESAVAEGQEGGEEAAAGGVPTEMNGETGKDSGKKTNKKQKSKKNGAAEEGGEQRDGEKGGEQLASSAPSSTPLPSLEVGFSLRNFSAGTVKDQQELIARAFASDHLEEEFEAAKEAERAAEEEKEDVAGSLPGWGSWAGDGITPKKAPAKPKPPRKPRADDKLKHVVLSEKKDKKARKFQVESVPHGFSSLEHYERSIRQPLGKEWNTLQSHRQMTLPRITVRTGHVIDPIKFSRKTYEMLEAKTTKKKMVKGQ